MAMQAALYTLFWPEGVGVEAQAPIEKGGGAISSVELVGTGFLQRK